MLFSQRAAADRKEMKELVYEELDAALKLQNWSLVAQVKEHLRQLKQYEQQGIIIRSRQQQVGEEEQAGLYYIGKEIQNSNKNQISKLKDEVRLGEHQVKEDREKIDEALFKFNEALFGSRLDKNLKDTGVVMTSQLQLH